MTRVVVLPPCPRGMAAPFIFGAVVCSGVHAAQTAPLSFGFTAGKLGDFTARQTAARVAYGAPAPAPRLVVFA